MTDPTDDAGFSICYDGYDMCLKHPFCCGCSLDSIDLVARPSSEQKKNVKKCSSCKLIYYCSKECQRKDWKRHKQLCRKFKKLREDIDNQANVIREAFDRPELVGHFWEFGRRYLIARFDLALALHPVAYQFNIWEYWEEVNTHMQEVLRLGHCFEFYDLGVRAKFPKFLLNVGRLDDAYSFCRYMVKREGGSEQVNLDIQKGSKEGDWIYPREKNCHLRDFLQDCSEVDPGVMNFQHLAAVWLVKMKLIGIHVTYQLAWKCFTRTDLARQFFVDDTHIGFEIFGFLVDRLCERWRDYRNALRAQRRQRDELANHIHALNPYIFRFMLEWMESGGQLRARTQENGDSDEEVEAWFVVYDSDYSLRTVPYLEPWLREFLG